MRALKQLHTPGAGASSADLPDESALCSCGHVEGRPSDAYNEEAFRYFLEIERRRSEKSGRPFLLLLLDLRRPGGTSSLMSSALANELFARLAGCLRETDFVGWYRDMRIVGAVLTQRPDKPQGDFCEQVARRVRQALSERFEPHVSSRLQVCVHRSPPMPECELPAHEGQS
jgi:hypothetical protein